MSPADTKVAGCVTRVLFRDTCPPVSRRSASRRLATPDRDGMAGLVPRIGLLVLQRVGDRVGNVLDQRAAERNRQELLTAADAEYRHPPFQRPGGESHFSGRAAFLQGHCRMAVAVT